MAAETKLAGRFVWHDLMTTDEEKSLSFYRTLFPEWTINGIDMGDAGIYHSIEIDGCEIGGMVEMEQGDRIPAHWVSYVAVDNCDATVGKCEQIGGSIPMPAISVPNVGRFAVLQDDQGAAFKPFEVAREIARPAGTTNGQFVWHELLTTDTAKARSFYQTLFGWSSFETPTPDIGPYVMFRIGDEDIAGSLTLPGDAEASPNWLVYLSASDIDTRANTVNELGGTTYVEPRDIPEIGRFSVHADPTGAAFALFRAASSGAIS